MTNFIFNDGGRASTGRKGTTRDCAVRSMAIALKLSYDDCYKEVATANKSFGFSKSARNGLMKNVFDYVLKQHGWIWHSAPKFEGRKARCSDLSGTVIARQSKHFVAVIDGVPQDIFDSSEKMVYGYWVKP